MVVWASGLVACSAARGVRLRAGVDYGEDGGKVWVRGPWEAIAPAKNPDEVIDQLCPAVERLERARDGDDGVEYCGLLYSRADGLNYASVPSPLGLPRHQKPGPNKSCRVPATLRDDRESPDVVADFHSHPWPDTPFSRGDLSSRQQRWSFRIQFDTTCRVYKYVPHMGEPRPGEVFLRVGKNWQPQSIVRTDDKRTGVATPPLEVLP
jgi:proteasome lid subunit RPN8/RPN11